MSRKLNVLFLCTGNSCRSQMAEGWARHLKGDAIEAYSAGIEKHGLNPHAVEVMAEAGVDITSHFSKTLDDLADVRFDYVVTVCGHAHETCPWFPGEATVVHHGFDDPPKLAKNETDPEKALNHYRRVRDEIRAYVESLPQSLETQSRENRSIHNGELDGEPAQKPTVNISEAAPAKISGISFFEKNLTLWVALCMIGGVLVGRFLPAVPGFLSRFEYANVSIPIAVLIWLMIYPMMMKVDFTSIKNVRKEPKGLYLTWVVNWLIKPFTMFGIAYFFFFFVFKALIPNELAKDYLTGAVLLGAAPCTAMVFVWSHLTRGNPAYTVVQVATNDLIILVAFTPIVVFLLGVGGITIPWDTLILSVVLFVVIPLAGGILTRSAVIKRKGEDYFHHSFIPRFNNFTIAGLLLTLLLIFSFQGDVILSNPLHIVLIAIPLIIQTVFIFFLAYFAGKKLRLCHDIAAPAGMIGASNFFELSVAVAITLFGASSPVVLATIVGVLVEVPVMLALVKFANRTTDWFPARATEGIEQKKELPRKEHQNV